MAAALVGAVAAGACRAPRQGGGRGTVRIAAAADLNVALAEVITRFTAGRQVDVSASYGSSGTFFAQLMNGAPFDLFLSADVEYPRRLAERGLTLPGSAFTYAVGRLVLWVPAGSALDVQGGGLEALRDPAVRRVAIANPDHAPYGRAAMAALQTADLLDAVKPRLVYGENVAQALQFAQSGAADAGIVALSLALSPAVRESGRWVELPSGAYPRIEQGGAILSWAADPDAARTFRAFLIGGEGRAILQHYGFSVPAP
jgi:molybdate transport system substrate-binding protein